MTRAAERLMSVVLPWPTRQQRRDAITAARHAKEQSIRDAAQATDLRERVEREAKETRGGRRSLRVLLDGPVPGRADCPVLQSGRLADCPVFHSGHLTD